MRLEKLRTRYLKQEKIYSSSSQLGKQGLRIYINIYDWIQDIKEDMRLNALQKINDGEAWKKEYECIFSEEPI